MRLPRAGLKKRCGTALLDLLDRANGDAPDVYEWFDTPPTFQARAELPDRIEHAEACLFAARRLVVQLTGWLSQKQLAVTRIVLLLEHERGRDAIDPTAIEVSLAEPTWREDHLVRLLKERLTRVELAAAVIALQLVVREVKEAEAASDSLFPEPGGSASDHARLLELLVARLGPENVLRPAPVADHRPEVAARWVSVTDKTSTSRRRRTRRARHGCSKLRSSCSCVAKGPSMARRCALSLQASALRQVGFRASR